MKKIVLIRHAEPVPADAGMDDFERPLVPMGERQSEETGRILKSAGIFPDRIFTSPAERALRTAAIIAEKIGFDAQSVSQVPGLYNRMDGNDLLGFIRKTGETVSILFFVGHEPSMSHFGEFFVSAFKSNFPKAGVLIINYEVDEWHQIVPGRGAVTLFDFPRLKKE